jgi:hypothetical protein
VPLDEAPAKRMELGLVSYLDRAEKTENEPGVDLEFRVGIPDTWEARETVATAAPTFPNSILMQLYPEPIHPHQSGELFL